MEPLPDPRPTTPSWDLNCDLGEGEPPERTTELMLEIDSANIACGAHAGDVASMRRCLETAALHGVHAGAHPGFPDRAGFGRTLPASFLLTPAILVAMLREQIGILDALSREWGVPLHHVKLHGALYHAVDGDPELARAYLEIVGRDWPALKVYARAGGGVARVGRTMIAPPEIWEEGYLDRAYLDDGTLVPRTAPDAVLESVDDVLARVRDLRDGGRCRTISGNWLALAARTWCVHGDSPGAVNLLRAVGRFRGRDRRSAQRA